MSRLSSLSTLAAFLLIAAPLACSPSKPPESPEGSSDPAAKEQPSADMPKEGKDEPGPAAASTGNSGEKPAPSKPEVDKGMSLDTYEMTPSDCNELGRHYGEVARKDQMAGLSPKLTEKQRSSTMAQIDKVVGKLEESWTSGCHTSLENKAVDHASIKCALAARTVKDFDVCINGPGGTPQPAGKSPGGKKK